ncbi:MAG: PEP-CTERM sorting domain-containing protein, partial [Myxococcales bacterium]|nr:PEP-CTERM sorting domain-containing protein [Myxococcales bacterium]
GNPDYFNVVATNFSSFISTWQDFMDYGAGGANTLKIGELRLNTVRISDSVGWTAYAIPEPSTFALLALGVLALGIKSRRAAA